MYLVSVLVPVYKVENYIQRCARCLFSQTYDNLEFIFVDDCTPDKSIVKLKEVVEEYPQIESRIRIIKHDKNSGLSCARNTAIASAKGEFLFFVDSDDYVEKDAIQLLVKKQLETGADIVSGNAYRHFHDKTIELREPAYKTKEDMVCGLIQATYDHVIWRRIIRRTLFTDNNIRMKEGVNQGEDWQVMPRLAYFANKFATIDSFIYHYDCTNENSYMQLQRNQFNSNLCEQNRASMNIVKSFFKDKGAPYEEAVGIMEAKFCSGYLYQCSRFGEKEYYNQFLSELQALPSIYYKHIGWNKPLKRFLNRHYSLMRLRIVLLKLKRRIKSINPF